MGMHRREPKPELNQAERLIQKFGGARRLAVLLRQVEPTKKWTASAIYRWSYPEAKGGRGGVVPQRHWALIEKAARLDGIVLSLDDFMPGRK